MNIGIFDIRDKKNLKNVYAAVAIIFCVGVSYYFYDFTWTDFQNKKHELVANRDAAQEELDRINAQRPRIPMLETELQNAQMEFERLKEMFPEEEKVPNRLRDLYTAVRTSGVNIQAFRPNGTEEEEHFIRNNYTFNINAGYHMLGYLFAEIAGFNYPTSIDNLKLTRSGIISQEVRRAEDHGWQAITMNVSFDLTTFTSRSR
ncbi:MAG: type 4a pilus biogenesis protein PilO [Fibromonadaceae bacterium]|nr:type 4a pilus biogenesis protein PilO [Fibromonadaceae bacterium]